MTKHLTEAEVDQYSRRALTGAELLRLTDHIAGCEPCREQLRARVDISSAQAAIVRDLDQSAEHLSEEMIQACVDRTLNAHDRRWAEAHLAQCRSCAQDVQDLQSFASGRPKPRSSLWYAAIAAGLFLLIASALLVSRHPVTQTASLQDASGLDRLPQWEQEVVRQALASGNVPLPEFLREIAPERGTLMGNAPLGPFRLITPVAIAVRSQQPTFRWSDAPEAVTYTVTLQELGSADLITSATISSSEWTIASPLPRGRTYTWQVLAKSSRGEILAPQPPLPPARFRVLDAATEAKIEGLPASHLVRGVFYARAGLFREAEDELRVLSNMNPGAKNVSELLHQIQQVPGR